MSGCKPNVEGKRFVQVILTMPVAKARCLGIILLFPVSIGRLFAPWRRSQNRCGSVQVLNPTMMGGIVGTGGSGSEPQRPRRSKTCVVFRPPTPTPPQGKSLQESFLYASRGT